MAGKNTYLSDEQLRLLIDSMSSQFRNGDGQAAQTMNMLIKETVRFRDKLKAETGETLTVADTRVALDALGQHLNGEGLPRDLTPEQKALTRIWIDRLTLFGSD